MHLVLLSGGSGKRLWPLSNEVRSKQFLKLLKDESGNPLSMVQRVFGQISQVGDWSSVNVVAGNTQRDMLELQIGSGYHMIVEKERRDTFPAISLACSYIVSNLNGSYDDTVCVLPVDSYVDDEYFFKLKELERGLEEGCDYMLLGVKPTFPTEKYGYIVPKNNGRNEGAGTQREVLQKVDRFVEKPKKELAEEIIGEGALWNCGVFCFKIRSIKEYLEKEYAIRDFSYESIDQNFSTLPKKSFDYEVLEKAGNIGVVSYQGMWMDLGTWQTVTSEMSSLKEGNVLLGEHCNNTHVINDLGLPIVVMGVEDSVVVASNDGILVSKKDETYKLKDLVGDFDKRPMYERKRWGKYRVIHEGENIITKQLLIFEGKQLSYQYHEFRKEIWTIIKGEGELYHEGKKTRVFPGDVVQIENREKHGIRAIKDLEIIEVQMGEKLSEDDIIRLEMEW